jgi:hypothetical protein
LYHSGKIKRDWQLAAGCPAQFFAGLFRGLRKFAAREAPTLFFGVIGEIVIGSFMRRRGVPLRVIAQRQCRPGHDHALDLVGTLALARSGSR